MKQERREELGQIVRAAWIAWAREQPDPKPTWLVPWEELSEPDKEADRRIGEAVLYYLLTDLYEQVTPKKKGKEPMQWVLLSTILTIVMVCLVVIQIAHPNNPYTWILTVLEVALVVGNLLIARHIRRGVS